MFMMARLTAEHPARNGIELFDQLRITRLWCRDQRCIERAIGTDRASLVLA
jgi:hypothetical protein